MRCVGKPDTEFPAREQEITARSAKLSAAHSTYPNDIAQQTNTHFSYYQRGVAQTATQLLHHAVEPVLPVALSTEIGSLLLQLCPELPSTRSSRPTHRAGERH